MIPTLESLKAWETTEYGYRLFISGGEVEIYLEQLIFDNQWYLAVYNDGNLVAPKVVVKMGKK